MFYMPRKARAVTLGPSEPASTGRQLVLDTNIYASGDAIHSGVLTLFVNDNGGQMVYLTKALVLDKAAQNPALRIYFFDSIPTAPVFNTAYAPSDADLFSLVGVVDIAAGTALSANSYKDLVLSIGEPMKPRGKNLYAVIVLTAGTPTWAASDLEITLYFEQG